MILTPGAPLHLALLALTAALPVRTAAAPQPQTGAQGQALFEARCAACHSTGPDRLVGPGLQGVTQRRDRAWLVAFIRDPDEVIDRGDSIAAALLREYTIPMPDFDLTREQAESILDYLAETEATVPATPRRAERPAGDPAVGRALFTGRFDLENGGAACISCHDVAGLGPVGGGTLAKNLTRAAAVYGGGLRAVLETPPFPAMQAVYAAHPLTPDEVANLSAYLVEAEHGDVAANSRLPFAAAGLGGMVLLTLLAGLVWRGRLRDVRKPLIGDR